MKNRDFKATDIAAVGAALVLLAGAYGQVLMVYYEYIGLRALRALLGL